MDPFTIIGDIIERLEAGEIGAAMESFGHLVEWRSNGGFLPIASTLRERLVERGIIDGPWETRPTREQATRDHETNPEYELHVGQVAADGRRLTSIWLRGERFTGYLAPNPIDRVIPPG